MRNQIVRLSLSAALSTLACGPAEPAPGDEDVAAAARPLTPGNAFCFVWADGTSPPPAGYRYCSTGGAISYSSLGVGISQVSLGGIAGPGGVAHVSAYGSTDIRCKVEGWGGTPLTVTVRCHKANGLPASSPYVLWFEGRSGTSTIPAAYLWADQPSAASYTPSITYQYNSAGVLNTVQRIGPGNYSAILPSLGAGAGGSVRVTAYGTGAEHCKVGGWVASGTGQAVNVRCFNGAQPVDARFTLTYTRNNVFKRTEGQVWADQPTAPGCYTPDPYYQSNTYSRVNSACNTGAAGSHYVLYPELFASGARSSALVTAYGSGPEYCKVQSWYDAGRNAQVNLRCFDAAGLPVSTRFTQAYVNESFPIF